MKVKKPRKSGKSKVNLLLRNVPTIKGLKLFYEYAENYANLWSSDGKLNYLNYYLKLYKNEFNKTAHIFLSSHIRKETLTIYLPRKSETIEEHDGKDRWSEGKSIPTIYSFSHFSSAIKKDI